MQIKRFEARDMAEALKMIKKEFGSEAVILSAKTIKKPAGLLGTLKKSGVEITAASDRQPSSEVPADGPLQTAPPISKSDNLWPKDLIGAALDRIRLETKPSPADQSPTRSPSVDGEPPDANDPEIVALRLVLDEQGVCPPLGEEIIEAVLQGIPQRRELTRQRIKKEFNRILEKKISIASPILRAVGQPRTIALVGPTGAGKSSTIAKLAAVYALQKHYPVGIISLDHERIGSTVALEKYARIIGVPFAVAASGDQLQGTVRHYHNMAFIFIDTPGLGMAENEKINQLANFLGEVVLDEVHLLISAATKERDMQGLCEAFRTCRVNRLIFTKLDETADFGNLLNLLSQTNTPLAYVTRDQRIPGDIEAARSAAIADLILKPTGAAPAQKMEDKKPVFKNAAPIHMQLCNDDCYVANKNSDIFHHRSCKAVKRIASDNVQVFRSIPEAEAKNFKPCRMCCPEMPIKNSYFRKFAPQSAASR
jgi:flagellar biosynthesis protein FlhF